MRRRKTFLFAFLVLSLLLAACVRSGGTEGENSYTIYSVSYTHLTLPTKLEV